MFRGLALACFVVSLAGCTTLTEPPATGAAGSGPVQDACSDGVQGPGEAGVDCGGPCGGCPAGTACAVPSDCDDGVCSQGTCGAPACDDGRRNGSESDVDCGGSCDACVESASCTAGSDCESRVCAGSVCRAESCGDLTRNHGETGVDCGGPCGGCAAGERCEAAADCTDLRCVDDVCVRGSCRDGVHNQGESDEDCGGPCAACPEGATCQQAADCTSSVCVNDTCRSPSCDDGVANQGESDVDCGGPCDPCADGLACSWNRDCRSARCKGGICLVASCDDDTVNGGETGPDCGGPCDPCADGLACREDADCQSSACTEGFCAAPTCDDGRRNQEETAVDCGGGCTGCAAGLSCGFDADCWSRECVTAGTEDPCAFGEACTCTQALCDDRILNADESDVDCGGRLSGCARCGEGLRCSVHADCTTAFCNPLSRRCAVPRCGDGFAQPGERCDDGNDVNDDACSNACEPWRCGDGIVQPGADYNAVELVTPRPRYPRDLSVRAHVCDAGAACPGKACDVSADGAASEHGICQSLGHPRAVQVEWGSNVGIGDNPMLHANNWSCVDFECGAGVANVRRDCFGNRMLARISCGGEQCDDGAANSNSEPDACRESCRLPSCGDGVKDAGEDCDLGAGNGGALCGLDCLRP